MANVNEALSLLDSLRTVLVSRGQEIPSTSSSSTLNNATSQRPAAVLPSAFRQFLTSQPSTSTSRPAVSAKPAAKKRKVSGNVGRDKSFTKDILCIPPADWIGNTIPIPRAKARGKLVEQGLAGKIVLWSSWSNQRIIEEVPSLFGGAFGLEDGEQLPFRYLSIIAGMKKLAYPKVSASFQWSGATVAALAGQGGLYIESSLPIVKKEKNSNGNVVLKKRNTLQVDSDSSDDECNGSLPSLDQILDGADKTSLQSDTAGSVANQCSVADQYSASATEGYFRSYAEILGENDNLEDEDVHLQRVLEICARDSASKSDDYKEILQQHILSLIVDADDKPNPKNLLSVRRSYAFIDGIRKINRSTFIPNHGLSVKFADDTGASEGAVDAGGPTRQFLRIALYQLYHNHGLFGGPDHNKVLLLNSQARAKDMYRNCGKFLAISLCNGGGVGNCMSQAIYNFFVYGEEGSHPQITDVVDGQVQDMLVKINECTNKEAFEELLNDDQFAEQIFQSGFQAVPRFELKSSIINEVCRYHVLDRPRSALEQMKEGLKLLGILELITQYPEAFANLFCYKEAPLTPTVFEELFQVSYSDLTSAREQEEQVIMHWRDYLLDCQTGAAQATLAHVLIFATGANQVPPLGFDVTPSIAFWDDVRPKANTCLNRLYLPLHQYNCDIPYDTFKGYMDDGIINSPCFGMA